MWASNFGLDKITFTSTANTFDATGAKVPKITLDAPTYDATTDILTIPATYKGADDKVVHMNFFDFGDHGFINLTPVTPPTA